MKKYILTGAPGSGKTLIIRSLEIKGYAVVNEAATDVIAYEQALGNAAPWEDPRFIDEIIHLQKQREMQTAHVDSTMQFYILFGSGYPPLAFLLEDMKHINNFFKTNRVNFSIRVASVIANNLYDAAPMKTGERLSIFMLPPFQGNIKCNP